MSKSQPEKSRTSIYYKIDKALKNHEVIELPSTDAKILLDARNDRSIKNVNMLIMSGQQYSFEVLTYTVKKTNIYSGHKLIKTNKPKPFLQGFGERLMQYNIKDTLLRSIDRKLLGLIDNFNPIKILCAIYDPNHKNLTYICQVDREYLNRLKNDIEIIKSKFKKEPMHIWLTSTIKFAVKFTVFNRYNHGNEKYKIYPEYKIVKLEDMNKKNVHHKLVHIIDLIKEKYSFNGYLNRLLKAPMLKHNPKRSKMSTFFQSLEECQYRQIEHNIFNLIS